MNVCVTKCALGVTVDLRNAAKMCGRFWDSKAESPVAAKASKKVNKNKSSDQVDRIVSRVGQKLLHLRTEQGLSLQQLASISDVSGPAIHKIERSDMVPTITTLLKLCNALGVPVNTFIEDGEDEPEPVCYTPRNERSSVFTPHTGLFLEGISGPYQNFSAAAAVAVMAAGSNSGRKLLRHPGEELVHVISGEVAFYIGDKSYRLGPGDSLHFRGDVPHRWENVSAEQAEMVWFALRNE